MRTVVAAVVSWEDIQRYFGKGSMWKHVEEREGGISGRSMHFSYEIVPGPIQFAYKIEAKDDPSDSEEGVSKDPLKDIAKFLGHGLPGGEFFEKKASRPSGLAEHLRQVAASVEAWRSREGAVRMLRRAAVRPAVEWALRALRPHVARLAASETPDEAFEKLQQELRSKGWKAREDRDKHGPKLVLDVGGEYEGEISVDSIEYEYIFQLLGHPEVTETGTTGDPIQAFVRYYRSPKVKEAEEAIEAEERAKEPEKKEGWQDAPTVPPAAA